MNQSDYNRWAQTQLAQAREAGRRAAVLQQQAEQQQAMMNTAQSQSIEMRKGADGVYRMVGR